MQKTVVVSTLLLCLGLGSLLRAEDSDYGNDPASAHAILADGTLYEGEIASGDKDWFVFSPAAHTLYRITFKNLMYDYKYAYLYQYNGFPDLPGGSYNYAIHEQKSWQFYLEGSGDAYFKIEGGAGGYEFSVVALGVFGSDGHANTHDQAGQIVPNGQITGTITADETDHLDWFVFPTTAQHQYRVWLEQANNSNVTFQIVAAAGAPALSGNTSDMTLTSWQGESFKIRVYGNLNTLGNYYILHVDDVAQFTDLHGNTPGVATPLAESTLVETAIEYNSSILSDEDWFVFTPQAHGYYRLAFTNPAHDYKYVYLFQDRGLDTLTQSFYTYALYETHTSDFFVDAEQPCYFKVVGPVGDYSIQFDRLATIPPDAHSHNCAAPTPIAANGEPVAGTITFDTSPQQDWFVVATQPLHKYRITLERLANGDPAFTLYDNACKSLFSATCDMTFTSWYGQDYKLCVNANTSQIGNHYRLAITDLASYGDDYPNEARLATPIVKDGRWYDGVIEQTASLFSDEDWATFIAPVDGVYTFQFKNMENNYKYIYYYNTDQLDRPVQIDYSYSINMGLATKALTLTAGKKYVRITGPEGNYSFSVLSPEPRCGDLDHPYPPGDLNQDCLVDIEDLALLAAHWMTDGRPQ